MEKFIFIMNLNVFYVNTNFLEKKLEIYKVMYYNMQ